MENKNEFENENEKTVEKLDPKTYRVTQTLDNRIKQEAAAFQNTNAFLEHLLSLHDKENNSVKYPDYKANIESFSVLLSKLDSAYMAVIETGANASKFAREQVSKEIESLKQTILDLQEKNKELNNKINLNESNAAKNKVTLDETLNLNKNLEEINKKNTEIIETSKNQILYLTAELEKNKAFAEENKELNIKITKLKEDYNSILNAKTELENAVTQGHIKEELQLKQIAELKAEIKVYKDNIKELNAEHKQEVKDINAEFKEEIKGINLEHKEEIKNMNIQHKQVVADLKEEAKQKLEEQIKLNIAANEKEKELESEITAIKENCNSLKNKLEQITKLKDDLEIYKNDTKKLEEDYKQEIKNINLEHKKAITDLTASLEKRLESEIKLNERESKLREDTLENKISLLEQELFKKEEELKNSISKITKLEKENKQKGAAK